VLVEFLTFDYLCIEAEFFGRIQPVGIFLESLFIACHVQAAALGEADIFTNLDFEPAPDVHAFDHHRQLAPVPALATYPSPVAARLLAHDMTFFTQHDVHTLLRKKPGGRYADNATADYYDVRFLRT